MLFPAPLCPTSAAVLPPSIKKLNFLIAASLVFGYEKLVFLNSIFPLLIFKAGKLSTSFIERKLN